MAALCSRFRCFCQSYLYFGKDWNSGCQFNLGTAIRTAVVLVMAWIVVFVTGKQNTVNNIDRKSWLFLILSGFATGGSWLCYYRALQTGPASVIVPIDKLSILVTVAFSYIVFHEKLSLKSGTGLLLIDCWNVSFADITIIKKKDYLEKYNCGNWLFQVAEGYFMDLKQLQYFVACAQTGSFSDAAKVLYSNTAECEQGGQGTGGCAWNAAF